MTEQIKPSDVRSLKVAAFELQQKYRSRFEELENEMKAFRRSIQSLVALQQSQVDLLKSELTNDLRLLQMQIPSLPEES